MLQVVQIIIISPLPDWPAAEKMLDEDILEGYRAAFQNKIPVFP